MSPSRRELALVFLLCLAAGVRVFVFSAAFPFFSNIDEDLHFDLVTRYSLGRVPRTFDLLSEQTLAWIVPYASPEFLHTPDEFPGAKFPAPLWKQSPAEAAAEIAVTKAAWSGEINFESSQPPLYYTVAALWWRFGQLIGLTGIQSLYWIRFLNIPLIALLVWIGYVAARKVDPEHVDLRIGVPLLLTFIPHNVFYSLNNDVLSAICGGGLFLCVLRWLQIERPTFGLGVMTGLAMATAYLTKLANLPLIIVALVAIIAKLLSILRKKSAPAPRAFVALVLCAAIPIATWVFWTKHHFGDLSGSTTKITLLGWTRKSFADWWHHPIFTPRGLSIFWSELTAALWRGEMMWQNKSLSWPVADWFYSVSSLLLLCAAAIGLRRRAGLSSFQRQAILFAGASFLASVAFLGLLSIQFDFGSCINPSRAHPYFTSGRLLSGALVPFALVYVHGIAYLFRRIAPALPLLLVLMIVVFAITSGILINWAVFASEHNWFHR
jgi:hypothetical protein